MRPLTVSPVMRHITLICLVGITGIYSSCGTASGTKTPKVAPSQKVAAPEACGKRVWKWRNPLPSGNAVWAVAFGNNTYAAVGDGGSFFTSPDAAVWQHGTLCTYNKLRHIIFAAGQFVAVGDSGTIVTSTNAQDWFFRNSGTVQQFNAVAYGSGTFVAIGEDGTVSTSVDGVQWTVRPLAVKTDFRDIAYGAGLFTVMTYPNDLYTSPDGIVWTPRKEYGDDDTIFQSITFENDRFLAVGYAREVGGLILSSPDGIAWKKEDITIDARSILSVLYADSRYLAYGSAESFYGEALYTSSDLSTWTTILKKPPVSRFCFVNGQFVGSGRGVFTSSDGVSWTCRDSSHSAIKGTLLRCVAYGNNRFVAGGTGGVVSTSTDGVSWVAGTTKIGENIAFLYVKADHFVAVGENSVFSSFDGESWKRCTESSGFMPMTKTPGFYVSVGDFGMIKTSADGVSWARCESGTKKKLTAVAHGAGRTVVVGEDGTIVSSIDGKTWKAQQAVEEDLNSIAFDGTTFVAVGWEGVILSSKDGVSWERDISGTSGLLLGVACGAGQCIAVGQSTILSFPGQPNASSQDSASKNDSAVGLWGNTVGYISRSGAIEFSEPFTTANDEPFSYPELPQNAASVAEFTPEGWSVMALDSGDLNNDKLTDFAMVLQYDDSIPVGDGEEAVLAQPRILAIMFKNNEDNRYDRIMQNNTFIPMNDEPFREDPFGELSIKKGVLQLSFSLFYSAGSWSVTGYSYKFRYQDDDFALIGADVSIFWRNGANPEENHSYNFITKKKQSVIDGKTTWSAIKTTGTITLGATEDALAIDLDGEL